MLTSFTIAAKDFIGRLTDINRLKFTLLFTIRDLGDFTDERVLFSCSWDFCLEFLHSC